MKCQQLNSIVIYINGIQNQLFPAITTYSKTNNKKMEISGLVKIRILLKTVDLYSKNHYGT